MLQMAQAMSPAMNYSPHGYLGSFPSAHPTYGHQYSFPDTVDTQHDVAAEEPPN